MRLVNEINERLKRAGTWVAVISLSLMIGSVPFLAGAAYTSWRSLWFQFAATETEGTVVAISAGTPSLTIEYRVPGGQILRTESARSDIYRSFSRGDRISVFYDPKQPADVRLEFWIENWLVPSLMAVPGATMLVLAALILAAIRKDPRARPEPAPGTTLVQAELVIVRIGPRTAHERDGKRASGDYTLTKEAGRYQLMHNGVKRDPYDPAVQRELGLAYFVEARGKDPKAGTELFFDSEPLDTNPEELLEGKTIPIYLDTKNPGEYRMELPLEKKP